MRPVVVVVLLVACGEAGAPTTAPAAGTSPATVTNASTAAALSVVRHPELARYAIAVGLGGCVRTDAAKVACWVPDMGIEYAGSRTPREVPGLFDIVGVASFTTVNCAWDAKGAAWCWSDEDAKPTQLGVANVVEIAGGHKVVCARYRDHTVTCWNGEKPLDARSTFVIPITDAVELASDDNEWMCARHASGAVSCWHETDANSLVRMPGVTHATSLAATDLWWENNSTALVAVLQDKQLFGWVPEHQRSWRMPAIDDDTTRVVMGSGRACVMGARVACWEVNQTVAPHVVPDLDHVLAVAVGLPLCAVRGDGTLACWGPYGHLGDGEPQALAQPAAVSDLDDAVQLAAGSATTCARRATGRVAWWGASLVGGDAAATPADAGISDAIDLVVGDMLACVRRANKETACWGARDEDTIWSSPRAIAAMANADRLVVLNGTPCAIRGGHTHCVATPDSDGHKLRRDPQALWIGGRDGCARYASGVECWSKPVAPVRRADIDDRAIQKWADVVDLAFDPWRPITWVLRKDGTVRSGDDGDPVASDARAMVLVGSLDSQVCVLHATGTVSCHDRDKGSDIAGITDGVELVTTGSVLCVRRSNHHVACWGGRDGIGNGGSSHRETPGLVRVRL